MSKDCKEKPAGRTNVRPKALTLQTAAQMMKAATSHAGQPSFSPLRRCESLKALGLPSLSRLAGSKNNAVRRSKIYGS